MEIEYDFEQDEYLARDSYLGNQQIKRHGVVEKWTHEKLVEYQKCASDPLYFIENYMKIITLDHGLVNIELYKFQKEMIQTFHDERYTICLLPRQSSKCVHINTIIKIRNKKTGEIKEITIGDFYDLLSKNGE